MVFNMRNKSLKQITVVKELEKMEKNLKEGANIVWTKFPYSTSNLAVVKSSLNGLGWCGDNFRISFDENDIFIEKDHYSLKKRK
jgi:hypothetical protein